MEQTFEDIWSDLNCEHGELQVALISYLLMYDDG
jgi:hypothetical protein